MDIQYFFKVLLRRKWLLLLAMIVATSLAWFLVGLQKDTYKSKSIIETGIIAQRGINLEQDNPFIQKFIVESQFNNLIEQFRNRYSIRLLTYRLLLHDLIAETDGDTAFREPKIDEENPIVYTDEEMNQFIETMRYERDSVINSETDPIFKKMFNNLAKTYEYDHKSLIENMEIKRVGDTDYLSIEFESESPELSAYIVNNFVDDFIEYQKYLEGVEDAKTVKFYANLKKAKKKEIDNLNNKIANYKTNQAIVNLDEQSTITLSQIKELELDKEAANMQIKGFERSIDNVNKYLQKDNLGLSNDYSSAIFLSEDVQELKTKLDEVQDLYITNKTPAMKKQVEKVKKDYKNKVKDLADNYTKDSRRDRNDDSANLLSKRIDAEAELALAEESVRSIDKEIARLSNKAASYVSAEAFLEALNGDKTIAMEEYLILTEKLNEAQRITEGTTLPLDIQELGEVPEKPEPSNRAIIAAFAGIAAASICTLIIFLLTFFDNSMSSPSKFEKFAQVPLIGSLNEIKSKSLDFQELFGGETKDKRLQNFKESLRKIRYTIENSSANSFLFTSMKEQEGKTFALIALAYSLSMNNKKVLIIDTNFKNNTLTDMSNKTLLNNPLHNGQLPESGTKAKGLKTQLMINGNVDIIGNKGGSHSPSEILAGKNFRRVLEGFSTKYDYIFLESASLNEYSDTRELAPYVDKVVAVFDANSSLKNIDRESIDFLNNLNGKFMGGILNNVDLKNLN